ncbi:MAG: cation transporter [Bacteroidia bacterium]|nr:cation transporter [Bacteroidia bacterium]
MKKTTFRISKMDCPSEERLIRMKLDGLSNIKSLQFDIPDRKLTVIHSDDYNVINQRLDSLNFGSSFIESVNSDDPVFADNTVKENNLLWTVLGINLFFFFLEMFAGVFARSMGLVADSLDMLADSFVYGLALFAVGGTIIRKKRIAKLSGYFQLLLAILGFTEVIRRFVYMDSLPGFRTMIIISLLALCGNAVSLYLLQKSKSREAHMQASMIFTSNDVIANIGVIAAGVVVYLTQSMYPDLIIGTAVFVLVARGAFRILKLSE